ncbi:hypothetical protein ACLK1T_07570 [Escherichia coli]
MASENWEPTLASATKVAASTGKPATPKALADMGIDSLLES